MPALQVPAWTRSFYGAGNFRAAHIDAQGSVVLAGLVYYPADLGSGPLVDPSGTNSGLAAARIGADGVLRENRVVTTALAHPSITVSTVDPAGNLVGCVAGAGAAGAGAAGAGAGGATIAAAAEADAVAAPAFGLSA